ncbi:MAG: glycosyltransferase family 39 protein [Acidobacteria bacterium]|nr:glycosyltransferase family 39 protein [Acidobacteriota bacterium]
MIHDYIQAGFPSPPLEYAQNYYVHYPKVAFGHWPPVYFVLQAAWTLLFGPSLVSVLILQCVVAALLFTLSHLLLRRWFEPWIAAPACLLVLTSAIVAQLSRTLGSELLLSFLVLATLLLVERFLQTPSPALAAATSALALAAVLTKGTALMLAPLTLIMVTAYGGWRILRLRFVWGSLALLAAVAVPWYFLVPGALHERVHRFGGLGWFSGPLRMKATLSFWPALFGWLGLALIFAGLLALLFSSRYRHLLPFGFVALAAPIVMLFFRLTVRVWEVRHLVACLPFLLFFLCLGFTELARVLGAGRAARTAVVVLAAAGAFLHVRAMPAKPRLGLDDVAVYLAAAGEPERPLLVVSDAVGEGALIAEMALHDERPAHRIDRGNKVFITANLMATDVRRNYSSQADLLRMLAALPHRAVVVDEAPHAAAFLAEVRLALSDPASGWRLERVFPRLSPAGEHRRILIWTRAPAASR